MGAPGLFESFLGAIQASLSVLLVMFYGGAAAYLKLIDRQSSRSISKICVRVFLPALLITKVGSQLRPESASRYLVIVLWGIVCHIVSFLIGIFAHRGLGMPDWTTVAILINNTTSYPLLLITALEDTGILRSLAGPGETIDDAIERAKSYFLVFSTISNCITFAIGPRLIDSEHEPDQEEDKNSDGDVHEQNHDPPEDVEANEQTRLLRPQPRPLTSSFPTRSQSFLLSRRPRSHSSRPEVKEDRRRPWFVPRKRWDQLTPRAKWWFLFIVDFFNAPLVGAIIGTVLGMVPALHRAFFNGSGEGGIFTAWLTASLKNVGILFVSLPVVVAGVSLFCSMKEAKQNHESAVNMPWGTVSFILIVRFILWPVMSIGVIYLLASKTSLLGSDPMLWFTLMMMPTGPPAMKLITLVQVADGTKDDEVHISKLLTISYIISPILSFTVVGSLMASQASLR
ncbi:hypothetical protein N656DRAFT_797868 [Canariomyces notabilis]|uniref:Auxin efflux carrier n=1 Tax=Canariomyces notabilis TaxID=2074819 RepID=A0AAN6YSB7_9PEZI|nr:hypothetical protein N656DRAFT_797868 [Canariomyces arenarius]